MFDSDITIERTKWDQLKDLIRKMELDVRKNACGNVAAGIRVRRGLRQIKRMTNEMINETINADKVQKRSRVEKRVKDRDHCKNTSDSHTYELKE